MSQENENFLGIMKMKIREKKTECIIKEQIMKKKNLRETQVREKGLNEREERKRIFPPLNEALPRVSFLGPACFGVSGFESEHISVKTPDIRIRTKPKIDDIEISQSPDLMTLAK